MATIAELITGIKSSKNDIKNAIISKGVSVADTDKLNTYASKINDIPIIESRITKYDTPTWKRPAGRPNPPTEEELPEGTMWFLMGCHENTTAVFTINLIANAANPSIIDWGDGTSPITNTSSIRVERTWSYDNLDIIPDENNIKWFFIKISLSSSQTTITQANCMPTYKPSNIYHSLDIYELYVNAPQLTTWTWNVNTYVYWKILEILDWRGKCNLDFTSTNYQYFAYNSYKLQYLNITPTKSFYNLYVFSNCVSLSKLENTQLPFSYSVIGSGWYNYKGPIVINSFYSNLLTYTFYDTTITESKFSSIRFINMTSVTKNINLHYTLLSAEQLALTFSDLYDRTNESSAGSINVSYTVGGKMLTKAQLAIAQDKGWTVVGATTID